MARIIALIICITLVVGGAVAAVGSIFFGWDIFGEQSTPEHTHQYSEEITKAPTCTEEGVKTFTCSVEGCDKPTYTEPVAKLPHTEVKLDGKAATCTEAGLSEGKKCSACGEITVKQETIPAAGHKEETLAAKAPTCTETGLTAGKKCSECDIVLEAQSTVPATGHKYDDEYDATCNNEGCDFVRDAACRHTNTEVLAAEAATCTKTGLTEGLKCKDCEEILTSQEIVPMIAHSWTLATCTAPKTCSVCKATEGEALGHHWKPATCTDPKTCQRENCGVTEGEALGHKWKDATCTAPQICSVCTATQGEALGHKWNAATCDTPNTCSVCKATEGSKLGHSYNAATYVWSDDYKTCTATMVCKNDPSHVVTETANATIQTASATCTAGGSVTYTATFTKEGFAKQTKSTTTNKLDHAYGETIYSWSIDYSSCTAQQKCTRVNCSASKSESADITSVTTPATCKDPGKIVYTAKFENFASNTKTKDLPVTTNHHYVTDPAVDATCKEPGLTEGKHCDVCGKVEIEQTETALAPHTYDDIYDAECNVCGNIRDAACRHTNTETLAAVAPTCTTAGKTEGKKCLDCGETYVPQTPVSALGHDWADATCLSPKTCQRAGCGATDGEPNGHDYDGQKVTYTWNANNSKCTASIVCKTNPAHVNTETVDVVITTEAPTCTEDGLKTYTATFEFEGFETQTKEEAIKTEGHKYTVLVETVAPTCEAKGYTLYKCSGCDSTEQRDWKNSTGHTYGATSYEWNGYETCTATRACVTNGCGHTETATATATGEVTKSSTCTENGTKTYTATFDKAWATVQTKTETLDKLVHGYGDTTYVWANDYSSCTASRTCANCGTQTATATVTSVTTDPECEKAGKTVYTATFTQDWCETKTHTQEINALTHSYKVENTEAEGALKSAATCTKQAVYYRSCEHCGKVSTSDNDTFKSGDLRAHNYGDITYSWTDYTACTATRTCQYNDCQHLDSANATVDEGEITTSATCTTAGVKTYTATFDKEGFETQTKTQEIPATGHTFGETVASNDATCILPGNSAYKQCTECKLYFAADAETNSTNGKDDTTSFVTSTIPHKWLHRECVYGCGTPFESTVIFDFGDKGNNTEHKDGTAIGNNNTFTVDNVTLTIKDATNVYSGAFDLPQNSCLKLGTSSKTASFNFTVPTNVTKVVIYVAGYKAKTVTIIVNEEEYAITTCSDNGEYTAIEVDTSETKTVAFATTTTGYRCMIDKIEFVASHDHEHVGGTATCQQAKVCDICDKEYGSVDTENGHDTVNKDKVDATCQAPGIEAGVWCNLCNDYISGGEVIEQEPNHVFVGGFCKWCETPEHTCNYEYSVVVTDPTCAAGGYTTHTCSCGKFITDNETEAVAHKDVEDNNYLCDFGCGTMVLPDADSTLTLAEANAIGNLFEKSKYTTVSYWVQGVIDSIDSDGSMTIKDGNGNSFYIYKSNGADETWYTNLTIKHIAGDTVKVYGAIGMYDAPQMQYGKTTVLSHNHDYSEATCQAPKTCPCGATDGEKADHNYVDGECTVCHAKKPAEGMTEVAVTVYIGEYAVTNNWVSSTKYLTINMDSLITVTTSGGSNTGKYYSSNSSWRIYQNESPSIVVTAAEGCTIKSVNIVYSYSNNGTLTFDEDNISSNTDVTINANSATFGVGNTGSAANGNIQITRIDVVYDKPADSGSGEGGETPDPTPEFTVTFDSDGGSSVDAQTVVEGGKATEPTAPTKDGYTFDGWFDGETKWDFDNDTVTGNITLTAKWTEENQGGGDAVCSHTDSTVDAKCDKCGATLLTDTLYYSGSKTYMVADKDHAADLNLDDDIFEVKAVKNSGSNLPYLYGTNQIRFYGSNDLIISVADGYEIVAIKVVYTTAQKVKFTSNDVEIKTTDGTSTTEIVAINANSVTMTNLATSQAKISSIEIVYAKTSEN